MNDNASSLKKICLVTDSYWPAIGGVEQWVHGIAAGLSRRSITVTVITHPSNPPVSPFSPRFFLGHNGEEYRDDAGNRVVALAPSGVRRWLLPPLLLWHVPLARRLFPIPLFDALSFFYSAAFMKTLGALVKDADVVHCFSTGYLAICATRACLRHGVPLVHSPPVHFGKWGDTPLLLRSYAQARAIMCLSQAFKTEFLKRLPAATAPIIVNPAPVALSRVMKDPGVSVGRPFVLFLGRREEHKGLALLIDSLGKMSCEATLVVAGPGNSCAAVGRGTIDLGPVDEQVKHWLLEQCALVCVPSRDESFGIVYAEAMAHAKPVVALDSAPVNEIVVHGETGLLIPPGRPDLLAGALDELLRDPEKRRRMGKKGYERFCEKYEENKVMETALALYTTVSAPS
jgi:glycosyltransferase involved in cell wall biosynthesis